MSAEMKRMIAETLHELLRKKPLDKITVKELADYCHISRQTFYYHFQDIMQVVEWDQDRVLNEVVQKSLSAADAREAVDVDYILHFYSCGLVGLMLRDLKQKNPDIEVIKNKIYRILNGELHLTFM